MFQLHHKRCCFSDLTIDLTIKAQNRIKSPPLQQLSPTWCSTLSWELHPSISKSLLTHLSEATPEKLGSEAHFFKKKLTKGHFLKIPLWNWQQWIWSWRKALAITREEIAIRFVFLFIFMWRRGKDWRKLKTGISPKSLSFPILTSFCVKHGLTGKHGFKCNWYRWMNHANFLQLSVLYCFFKVILTHESTRSTQNY